MMREIGYLLEMISPAQCRAARALLKWTQQELAESAEIGNATIRNFESGKSTLQSATLRVLAQTLQAAGVTFLDNGSVATGPGVALRSDT